MHEVRAPMKEIEQRILDTSKTIVNTFPKNGCMLGTSESVTGGGIAAALARVDGCSKVLFASQVVYSVPGKVAFMNVNPSDIEHHGTVSSFVIERMHASMVSRFTDCLSTHPGAFPEVPRRFLSLAVAGIAGEAIEGKPRGTVYLGINGYAVLGQGQLIMVASSNECPIFDGSRNAILLQAIEMALSRALIVAGATRDDDTFITR